MVEPFTKMGKNVGRSYLDFRGRIKDPECVMFEMPHTCLSGDVKQVAGYDNMEFS